MIVNGQQNTLVEGGVSVLRDDPVCQYFQLCHVVDGFDRFKDGSFHNYPAALERKRQNFGRGVPPQIQEDPNEKDNKKEPDESCVGGQKKQRDQCEGDQKENRQ